MTSKNKKLDITKEKIAGETKKAVGKITGNEKLELKGRIQSKTADIREKINNIIDKKDVKKKK